MKIEYVMFWSKKISLEQLLFELGNFFKPPSFLRYIFSRLGENWFVCFVNRYYLSLTFMNCEGTYLAEGFLDNLCPRFDNVFAPRRHHRNKQ